MGNLRKQMPKESTPKRVRGGGLRKRPLTEGQARTGPKHTVRAPWRDSQGQRTLWRMTSVPHPHRKAKRRAANKVARASRKANR